MQDRDTPPCDDSSSTRRPPTPVALFLLQHSIAGKQPLLSFAISCSIILLCVCPRPYTPSAKLCSGHGDFCLVLMMLWTCSLVMPSVASIIFDQNHPIKLNNQREPAANRHVFFPNKDWIVVLALKHATFLPVYKS